MSGVYILDLIQLLRHQFIAWESVWCLWYHCDISSPTKKSASRQLCHSLRILPLEDAARLLRGIVFEPQVLGKNCVTWFSKKWMSKVPAVVEILSYWGGGLLSQRPPIWSTKKNGGKNELAQNLEHKKRVSKYSCGNFDKFRQIAKPAGRVHWLSAVPHRHPWTDLERWILKNQKKKLFCRNILNDVDVTYVTPFCFSWENTNWAEYWSWPACKLPEVQAWSKKTTTNRTQTGKTM